MREMELGVPQLTLRWQYAAYFALAILAVACRGKDPLAPFQTSSPSLSKYVLGVHQSTELVEAASDIIGFLQGSVAYEQIHLADQVALHLAEEVLNPGGKNPLILSREELRDPSNWKVYSPRTEITYLFAPPRIDAELTTSVGRHFECQETTLAEHNLEELGRLPHVGTMLYPKNASSCLQSWNLTFVFNPNLKPPTLVAVVYAQWEW
jgi:hypothetical protein